jgi:hypothetical protein
VARFPHKPHLTVCNTLSPHWRPFALQDGGVLFIHPTQKQVMSWTADVLRLENEKAGMKGVHDEAVHKIQAIVARDSLDHISYQYWRKQHLDLLIRKHQRRNNSTPLVDYCKASEASRL